MVYTVQKRRYDMAGLGLVEFEETCPMPALIGWQAAEAACDWPRPDTNITTSQTEFSSSRLGTGQQARLQLSSGSLLQAGTGEDQGRQRGEGGRKVINQDSRIRRAVAGEGGQGQEKRAGKEQENRSWK